MPPCRHESGARLSACHAMRRSSFGINYLTASRTNPSKSWVPKKEDAAMQCYQTAAQIESQDRYHCYHRLAGMRLRHSNSLTHSQTHPFIHLSPLNQSRRKLGNLPNQSNLPHRARWWCVQQCTNALMHHHRANERRATLKYRSPSSLKKSPDKHVLSVVIPTRSDT
ncbi:hypothetical protein M426DRAFT_211195 [Hypoxylon sp. CI-4A]|nr:hypothetical protein M426DRAFT_211195 [Hypoxylon sp. CI-4A]